MSNDKQISGCVPRNASIPEELSRVKYIFTDKTGTLTKNEMTLKELLIYGDFEIDVYEEQQNNYMKIKKMLSKDLNSFSTTNMNDLENISASDININ